MSSNKILRNGVMYASLAAALITPGCQVLHGYNAVRDVSEVVYKWVKPSEKDSCTSHNSSSLDDCVEAK